MCGPSCRCYSCTNVNKNNTAESTNVQELEAIELIAEEKEMEEEYVEDSDNDDDDEYLRLEREVDEIMKYVFGEESEDEDETTT